jgi:hypothetical protein
MEENKDIEPDNPGEKIPEVEHSEMRPSREATTPFEDNILPKEEANTTNEQSSTINSQLSTEQEMEVHHHTHPAHGKKNWKSYFWEFLMLFLAVFCGFLAEYQLEHVIENKREKQYMRSMIRDLVADTASLNQDMPFKKERIAAIDSLFDYFSVHKDENTIPAYVHNLLRRSTWDRNYNRNKATISQLKNSGNMRLVRKQIVADSILAYDFTWEKADKNYNEAQGLNGELINEYMRKILNDYRLLPYYKANNTGGARLPEGSTITVKINTSFLIELLNHLHKVKTSTKNQMDYYQGINQMAEKLINLIGKEYDLE